MRSRGSRALSHSALAADGGEATAALVAAIRQPLIDLAAAAEEAQKGRLGVAKLGILVAASGIVKAIRAIDAEFARQHSGEPRLL